MTEAPDGSRPVDPPGSDPERVGAWSPLRRPVFRAIWLAVVVSNIGTWMQTVGAQLFLVDEPRSSALVALVQTASTLPVVLLALPGGVLADTFDRRRLLIAVQLYLTVAGGVMALLTALGQMRPPLLLVLTFALGVGTALTGPTYQSLIPELVPRSELRSASALGAVSMNVARAVGPAVAGLIITRIGTAAVFAINAATFVLFTAVLLAWRREQPDDVGRRERFGPAMRAGGRYVRHSPVVRRLVLRVIIFVSPAMALWALLPVVARDRLDLSASGYGVLLGALGVGAIAGAVLLPRVQAAWTSNQQLVATGAVFAAATAVVGLVQNVYVVLLVLLPAGAAWVAILSLVNASLQLFLPAWVRARGLAVYQMANFGAQAIAAALWGVLAETTTLPLTFAVSAGLMVLGVVSVAWWPVLEVPDRGREPLAYWEEPQLSLEPEPLGGPVMVQLTYDVLADDEPEFLAAMERVRRSRQRSGAQWWQIYLDGERQGRYVEVYLVGSWEEHLRQHDGRLTETDAAIEADARAFSQAPPEVHHLFPPGRGPRRAST